MIAKTRTTRAGSGRTRIAGAVILCVAASAAHAELEVCNKGQREKVQVAFAWREAFPFDPPWSLSAWQGIAPGTCSSLVTGNIDGYEFLIHAEAKGVTLTTAFAGDNVFDSHEKFCLVNAAVREDGVRSAANASACEEGEGLRSFPIRYAGVFADSTVNLYPDEVAAGTAANRDAQQEQLSAYFGAVSSAKDGYFGASGAATTRSKALQMALENCQNNSKLAATCELRYEYADRCIAMVDGDKEKHILAVGKRDGTESQARQWGLNRCSARGNASCNVSFSICSTHSASVENKAKQQLENLDSLADFAEKLFSPKN